MVTKQRPIFGDETGNSEILIKWICPRLRLFDFKNWRETRMRPRVSVPLVSRQRRDWNETLKKFPDIGMRPRKDFSKF